MLYSSHGLGEKSSEPNRKMKAKNLNECLGLISKRVLYSSHDLVKNSSYPNCKMKAKILKECLGLILKRVLRLNQ